MSTLYLIRHGENPANLTREFSYKKVDYSLTPKGILQARQTAAYFRQIGLDAIYSSPLKRALETAEIIAEMIGREVVVLEEFREINVGTLEGQPPTDENWRLHDQIIDAWYAGKPEIAFPGGENYHTLAARATSGIAQAIRDNTGRRIAVVAHGGTILAAVSRLCPGDHVREALARGYPNCGITEIEVRHDGVVDGASLTGVLRCWADARHLAESYTAR